MTQTESILAYLKAGNSITPLEALERFNCLRLSGRIFDIKQMGYDVRVTKERAGRKAWARYRIELPKGQLRFF